MKRFGKYKILRKIERNWVHFLVYRALLESSDREVELRLFRFLTKRGSDLDLRFMAEYEILSTLDHPSILKILELGYAQGHSFYVTDWRDALPVSGLLEERNAPLAPVMVVDGQVYGRMNPKRIETILDRYKNKEGG